MRPSLPGSDKINLCCLLLQGAAAMLAVLPCLQELRVLQLSPGLLAAPHAATEQYSALTSSRHLTFLCLYHCQLPAGAAGGGLLPKF
jgi:hypothetical protein